MTLYVLLKNIFIVLKGQNIDHCQNVSNDVQRSGISGPLLCYVSKKILNFSLGISHLTVSLNHMNARL